MARLFVMTFLLSLFAGTALAVGGTCNWDKRFFGSKTLPVRTDKELLDLGFTDPEPKTTSRRKRSLLSDPPPTFKLIDLYPKCKSIDVIWDQAYCNTCWAIAVASMLTDRFCIASGQTTNFYISAQQIAGCAAIAGSKKERCANDAGNAEVALAVALNGVATGGLFESGHGCVPYAVSPATRDTKTFSEIGCETQTCTNNPAVLSLKRETMAIRAIHTLNKNNLPLEPNDYPGRVKLIKQQIIEYGSVVTTFPMHEDFKTWSFLTQGPYERTNKDVKANPLLGHHVMRITGWGVYADPKHGDIPYWIMPNSYGTGCNDLGGFAWIKSGINMDGIEKMITYAEITSFSPAPDGKPVVNPCQAVDFCSDASAIDQAVSADISDPDAPFYLFKGNCVKVFAKNQDGNLVSLRPAVPTKWIFDAMTDGSELTAMPEGGVLKYKYVDMGGRRRLFLYNKDDQGVGCHRIADNKFGCGKISGQKLVPKPGDIRPRASFFVSDKVPVVSWLFDHGNAKSIIDEKSVITNPDDASANLPPADFLMGKLDTLTAMLNMGADPAKAGATRMAFFGQKSGKSLVLMGTYTESKDAKIKGKIELVAPVKPAITCPNPLMYQTV